MLPYLLPPAVVDLFFDANGSWVPSRYKVLHGGRGGIKSWTFARVAILVATHHKVNVTCAREYQNSIAESVHETLRTNIDLMELAPYFTVRDTYIASKVTGSMFTFAGIKTEPRKFKSREGIDILWIEEGEKVSEQSWITVTPTIRKPGSEIWCSFNPDLPTDPTSVRFMPVSAEKKQEPHPLARIRATSWRDNLWFSDEMRAEMEYMQRVDFDSYQHVWEGGYRQNSAAQVLSGKISVQAFEPQKDWHGPYYGADWGFSQDPTAGVKMWVNADRTKLYIEREAWKIGCEINDTPKLFDAGLGEDAKQHVMRGDCARPETISYMRQHGYPQITACEKWKGSVEDGVAHLRQYEQIVIHPRCTHAIEEGRLWSYKVDKLTQQVQPDLVDANNHIWDAARYGLEPLIKAPPGILDFYRLQAEQSKAVANAAK